MTVPQITVATTVALPRERAWRVYTDPADVMRWNFANDAWCCPAAAIDLRVGGAHKVRMEAKDGSFGFDLEGVYREVDAPSALVLELADGRRVRTTFAPAADGTMVTTVFDAEASNPVDVQRAGWQAILESYRRHAERPDAR